MTPADLRRLRALSALALETRLSGLRSAAADLARTQAQLVALDPGPADGLDPVTEGVVAARHAIWAGVQRAALMPVLADRTARCDAARDAAAKALGRVQVLDRWDRRR